MWTTLLALSLSVGTASADDAVHPFAVQVGAMSRFGLFGGAATYRFLPDWAVMAGAGMWGFGGGARYYVWKPLYVQGGYAPIMATPNGEQVYYGPDITGGVDLKKGRFSFTFGLGMGATPLGSGWETALTGDLGLGVNFGKEWMQ